MTARSLLAFFDAAYVLALTAWVGSILFVSFGVAPIIFPVLGAESGARFVRALYARYFAWGATCGAIALPAYLGVPLSYPEYRGPLVAVQALLIIASILITFYAGNTLTPAVNDARDAGPAGLARFERLHRRWVGLNGLLLVIGLGLLIAHATRPAPRTSGIAENGPRLERGDEYDAEIHEVIAAIEERQRHGAEGGARALGAGRPGAEVERFPIDEATIRELVKVFAQRRRPPAGTPSPR